ncbi:MAG: hypothetical protein R6X14_01040 [bacterium]
MLRPLQVDMSVPCRVGGVFGLGKDSRHVRLVGQADRNLREAIKSHWNKYEFFWFQTCLSPRDGYSRVCQQYHRLLSNGGLDASEHPAAPAGVDEKCPVCGR